MADAFRYEALKYKFACGKDFTDLTVVKLTGPAGAKMVAYSCNMNIDLDGDPQAYAPASKPHLRPMDNLGDAGWKGKEDNELLRQKYLHLKESLAGLEKQRADLVAKAAAANAPAAPGAPPAAAPAGKPDPALTALDEEIKALKKKIREVSFEHTDSKGDPAATNPKNFEKIFWKWYGVVALTPAQAKSMPPYLEIPALNITWRKPKLDTNPAYEDVFGRFPVVQSIFEPGPDYFVSPLPYAAGSVNPRFPSWDQRYFLPNDPKEQTAFGSLATPLANLTGLHKMDKIFAMRLDDNYTLEFPFRDTGNDFKVAECSLAAFTGLGGEYHPENTGAAQFPNNFLLLYLAFPNQQSPAAVLARFAEASNADDLPVLLSFLAQATVDAKAAGRKSVGGDPIHEFKVWKTKTNAPKPAVYTAVVNGLADVGVNFVQTMVKRYGGSLMTQSLELKP